MAQETQVRQIRIVTDVKGDAALKEISNQLGNMALKLKGVSTAAGLFNVGFTSFLGGISIRAVVNMSDEISLLATRIDVLSGSAEAGATAFAGVAAVAKRTYSSLTDVAQVYARMAATTKELNIPQGKLLQLTELLTNSFRLSGAGAQEATSAAIQLSQGFASGQLRGQELRSVLEANVFLGDALAKSFNVTRGELYKLAEAGKITAKGALRAIFLAQDDINEKAKQLTPTIGQSLTKAMIDLQLAVFRLNKEYQINARFADALSIATENLSGILTTIAIVSLPRLITQLKGLLAAFTAMNVFVGLVAIGIGLLVTSVDRLSDIVEVGKGVFYLFVEAIARVIGYMVKFAASLGAVGRFLNPFQEEMSNLARALGNFATEGQRSVGAALELSHTLTQFTDTVTDGTKEVEDFLRQLKFEESLKNVGGGIDKIKSQIAALNKQFLAGGLGIADYYDKLERLELSKLEEDFAKANISFEKFNEGKAKLAKLDLSRDFRLGSITAGEFKKALDRLNLKEVEQKFKSGKASLTEYNEAILKFKDDVNFGDVFKASVDNYIESIGTLAQQVSGVVNNSFTNLEDKLFEFVKTGKANFEEFTQAILDDLTKVLIRTFIVQNAVKAINAAINGSAYLPDAQLGGGPGVTAGADPFNPSTGAGFRKTAALYSGASTYQKTSDGMGGPAPVYMNIVNNAGVEVSSQESVAPGGGRVIDIMIEQKIQQSFASGKMDKTMASNYGVKRRGF